MRVHYVFSQRKLPLLEQWRAGQQPDTLLFGYNHLAALGIRATVWEPTYPAVGRWAAQQIGRLGPDVLQLRAWRQLRQADAALLIAGWPLLLVKRLRRWQRPRMLWLNMTLSTLLRRRTPLQHVLRWALGGADGIVCVAQAQADDLARRLGRPHRELPVVRSGVDARFHTAVSPADERPTGRPPFILAAGRDPGRDYGTLVGAAARLDVPLRIVAGRANVAGLMAAGNGHGGAARADRRLPANIELLLDQPPAKLRELYRAAACVAVPTHGDGWPHGSDCSGTLVLLDAMATGRAAVVSERRALADYIVPGREALTVPPGDVAALAAALRRLLDDRQLARRIGQAGRAAIEAGLTTRHFAAGLAPLLAGEPPRPAAGSGP